jgi:hypothetical protein
MKNKFHPLEQLGFTDAHIFKIARSEQFIIPTEQELIANIDLIEQMLKLGFTPQNIAAIFMQTASSFGKALYLLRRNLGQLEQVIANIGFTINVGFEYESYCAAPANWLFLHDTWQE